MKNQNDSELRALKETTLTSEFLYNGVILHLYKDTVQLPNGNTALREHIRHVGAVGIVPMTEDGCIMMERQFRYPLDSVIWEIPAGKLSAPEEDPLLAAKRELREETGFSASKWTPLGVYHPVAAYCNETIPLYLAEGLSSGKQELDSDEFLFVRKIPLQSLLQMIMDGEITDGKTQVALLKTARLLGL